MNALNKEIWARLKTLCRRIPPNTYRTIKGQLIKGNYTGAAKGIQRLEAENAESTNSRFGRGSDHTVRRD